MGASRSRQHSMGVHGPCWCEWLAKGRLSRPSYLFVQVSVRSQPWSRVWRLGQEGGYSLPGLFMYTAFSERISGQWTQSQNCGYIEGHVYRCGITGDLHCMPCQGEGGGAGGNGHTCPVVQGADGKKPASGILTSQGLSIWFQKPCVLRPWLVKMCFGGGSGKG